MNILCRFIRLIKGIGLFWCISVTGFPSVVRAAAIKFRGLRAKLNFPDGILPPVATAAIPGGSGSGSSQPSVEPSTTPIPVISTGSPSSLSQFSSRSTQSVYGSRTLPSSRTTTSELAPRITSSQHYYNPLAHLSSATSTHNLLHLQVAGSPSGGSSSGQLPGNFVQSASQQFSSQPLLPPPSAQWQQHQLHSLRRHAAQFDPVLPQSMSQNPELYSSSQMATVNLPYENVYSEEQAHDPILHYEEYMLGRSQSPVDFREADLGAGLHTLTHMSSSIQIGGTQVNNPSMTLANPRYIELSYEQIFDQPGESQSTFPEMVSPSGGLPLDPFPDDHLSPQG